MSRMNPKRKRRSKAVPVLGAAGLSLTLASEGSLAITAPPLDITTRNVIHEIALHEEEACDVTLATFHVFGKEGAKAFRAGDRPITLGQGCCLFACLAGQAASQNNAYSPPAARPIRPAHKPVRKKR
jgi:hypothetical protein